MDTNSPQPVEIPDLELRLRTAGERRRLAIAALAPKHKGGEWEEYHAANREVLRLERLLAAARGEEYAEPCGFPLKWDAGAPMPHLMVNDHRALLAFLLSEPDPAWDGSYTTIKSPGAASLNRWGWWSLSSARRRDSERRTTKCSRATRSPGVRADQHRHHRCGAFRLSCSTCQGSASRPLGSGISSG